MKNSLKVFNILYKNRLNIRILNGFLQFFLYSIFLILTAIFLNTNIYFSKLGSKVTFYAFLRNGISKEEIAKIKNTIQNWPEVNAIKLIKPDEGLKILKKSLGKESDILATLETNPLPATLEINIKSDFTEKIYLEQIGEKLKRISSIEWFDTTEKYIGNVVAIKDLLYKIFVIGVSLIFIVILLSLRMMAQIMLNKYNDNIMLLKMLGASRKFIITPFVVEGFLESFICALIAVLTTNYVFFILKYELERLDVSFQLLPLSFYAIFIVFTSIIGGLSNIPSRKKI
ncbi:MAG: permease-like cell division protein FtsX [Proteobacteria bacterium]|nr:permease-like cell division protein FtsX [Pseudomonadota bacterium]